MENGLALIKKWIAIAIVTKNIDFFNSDYFLHHISKSCINLEHKTF